METTTAERRKRLVLFLCVGNSARCQMSEAILRHYAGDKFDVASAGLEPKPIDPMTLAVLEEKGFDTSELRSKGTQEFLGKAPVNVAIVVCEIATEECPRFFPFTMNNLYWPFPDPVSFVGNTGARLETFRDVRDQVEDKILRWLNEELPQGEGTD